MRVLGEPIASDNATKAMGENGNVGVASCFTYVLDMFFKAGNGSIHGTPQADIAEGAGAKIIVDKSFIEKVPRGACAKNAVNEHNRGVGTVLWGFFWHTQPGYGDDRPDGVK